MVCGVLLVLCARIHYKPKACLFRARAHLDKTIVQLFSRAFIPMNLHVGAHKVYARSYHYWRFLKVFTYLKSFETFRIDPISTLCLASVSVYRKKQIKMQVATPK